jgi:hypothetical protein
MLTRSQDRKTNNSLIGGDIRKGMFLGGQMSTNLDEEGQSDVDNPPSGQKNVLDNTWW